MRFFFDIGGGTTDSKDDEGCDCVDSEGARRLALQALTAIAAEEILKTDPPQFSVLVRDETGKAIMTTRLMVEFSWLT